MKRGILFAVGAAAFTAVQAAWSLGHAFLGWRAAWVMKTGAGIGFSFVVFALVGAVVVAWRPKPAELLLRTGTTLGGALVAMAVALMILGPGNLWPLVIVFDGAILMGALLFGGVLGPRISPPRA